MPMASAASLAAAAAAAAPAPVTVTAAPAQVAAALPPGWQSAFDTSGNEYFVNSTTGVSQWERPQAGPAPAHSAASQQRGYAVSAAPRSSVPHPHAHPHAGGGASVPAASAYQYASHPSAVAAAAPAPIPEPVSPEAVEAARSLAEIVAALESSVTNAVDKREAADARKGMEVLAACLSGNGHSVPAATQTKLVAFTAALNSRDTTTAKSLELEMRGSPAWEKHKDWMKALSRIMHLTNKVMP